eukprot:Clim_evm57s77 gene=Clim_evmTU57s77
MADAKKRAAMAEIERMQSDPDYVLEVAIGPPMPDLKPQDPEKTIKYAGKFLKENTRFIFKKAHLSRDDYRIFDSKGQLVLVSHHEGKNPYDSLDPYNVGSDQTRWGSLGELKSLCEVTGYHGMPRFKVRPVNMTMHGRQRVIDLSSNKVILNVAKQSRVSTMSVRHSYEVNDGDNKDPDIYRIVADMSGRTFMWINENDEQCVFVQKPTKTLILNAAMGKGSELTIDIAEGMDWTAVLAGLIAMKQVGEHLVKDVLDNFVVEPLTERFIDTAVEATGTEEVYHQAQQTQDSFTHYVKSNHHTIELIQKNFFS